MKISHNLMRGIPPSIRLLTNLEVLDVSDNDVDNLSDKIGNLKKLRRFILAGNKLSVLPQTFGNLTNLKVLDLRSNQFTALPQIIAFLTNLEDLDIQENSMNLARAEIPGLGIVGMIRYFQAFSRCEVTGNLNLDVLGIHEIPHERKQTGQVDRIIFALDTTAASGYEE
eukprot:753955-Hanusia_phi.AAC.2